MANKFYITTTLPYVNAEPHIGFALEIIQADVLARYHRLQGKDIFFNTGTDEHGLKIYRCALNEKKDPQQYCDEYAQKFNNLKRALNLSYNNFIRTTDKNHIEAAVEFWERCKKNGDIYKAKKKIKYCVGCELEKTDSELKDGCCPLHPNTKLEILEEENYFFRFSKYQKPLLNFYQKRPNFVIPQNRFNEIKSFVSAGLKDFSISRLKSKLPWGIPVPNDPEHVMYVWFDALINYVSAVGWPKKISEFNQWWPAIQIAGKDNLRQQSAMWQAMLMSAGLPCSKQIFIHGFITCEGQKISKSLGNVINPFNLVEKYGTDSVRYYLLKEIPAYEDGDFSLARFKEVYNADLANNLGNLVARLAKLCEKYGELPSFANKFTFSNTVKEKLEIFRFNDAVQSILNSISEENKRFNQEKPWNLGNQKLKKFLVDSVQHLCQIAFDLQPFIPQSAEKILDQFSRPIIKTQKPLFPRLE